MIDPDQIHERVTRLEHQMRYVRKDAADARFLASAADQNVADLHTELRAHRSSLNALRQTQVEHLHEMREGFTKVDEQFTKVDDQFTKVDDQFTKVDEQFTGVRGQIAELDGRMRDGFGKMAVGMGRITELLTPKPDDRPAGS